MIKIALRNVLRNKRRSILSLSIIFSGVIILFLVNGYKSYVYWGMEQQAIGQFGNFEIAKSNYWDQKDDQRHLMTKDELDKVGSILTKETSIKEFTSELSIPGVLGTELGGTMVSGVGVEPGSNRTQHLAIKEGTNLFSTDTNRVVIGQGIMKKLNLKIDEWVSLMTTTLDGAYNAGNLQISGSYSTGNSDADNYSIVVPLNFVQETLNTDGADKFIVYLKDSEKTSVMINKISQIFKKNQLDVKIKSWSELAVLYHEVRGMYDLIFLFLSIVIFILVFLSIFEIMSMAFFERMQEIGTTRAIGTKRYQVLFLLIEEATTLGVIGGILGVVLGWGIGAFINSLNITYFPPTISQPIPLRFELAIINGLTPFLIVVVASIFSALNPAIKASRISVVEMLRHV